MNTRKSEVLRRKCVILSHGRDDAEPNTSNNLAPIKKILIPNGLVFIVFLGPILILAAFNPFFEHVFGPPSPTNAY